MSTVLAPHPTGTAPTITLPARRDARSRRWRWLLPTLIAIVVIMSVLNLLFGLETIFTPAEAWRGLWGGADVDPLTELAMSVRMPRTILAILAGLSMGAAGALLQALTRNPLASPDLTGVTEGAVAAAVSWIAFGPAVPFGFATWGRPLVATFGGLATAGVVYLLARRSGKIESTRLLLIGILVGGVLSSVTSVGMLFLGGRAEQLLEWLSGSLANKTWDDALLVMVYLIPGFLLLGTVSARANAMQLGDDVAHALGQRREWDRFLVLIVCVLITAGVVAVVGALGFVGLMAPHLIRRSVGSDLRRLVPASALTGACMMIFADFLARNIDISWIFGSLVDNAAGNTLPDGIYLALFGIPFLASLLWRRGRA